MGAAQRSLQSQRRSPRFTLLAKPRQSCPPISILSYLCRGGAEGALLGGLHRYNQRSRGGVGAGMLWAGGGLGGEGGGVKGVPEI